MGLMGVLLAAPLSPRPISVLHCHPPSHLEAHGAGRACVCPCSGKGAEHSQLMTGMGASRWERRCHRAQPGCPWRHRLAPTCLPSFRQIAKQSLRPFCTVCNRYFKTPRKFVEHVKSQGHKDKAKEVTPAPSEAMGPERPRALTEATQRVEVYPSLNSAGPEGLGLSGVGVGWHLGCPELT